MDEVAFRDRVANTFGRMLKNVPGGYLGRQRFQLTYMIYNFLPFFGYNYQRKIEWEFVLRNIPRTRRLKILDIGCASSLFIYELGLYGQVFGIDSRFYFEKLPRSVKFIQCDASRTPFTDNYFDCITMISVIEHIGLGFYSDPVYENGDFKTMMETKRILKDGGVFFLTTNIAERYIALPKINERIYDQERLAKLIEDFSVSREEYFVFQKRWTPVDKKTAFRISANKFAVACLELIKKV